VTAHAVPQAAQNHEPDVYCGAAATDWDHLRPLVRGKRPTGYVNEVRNLVPSCGPCNQSKSGSDWRRWIDGTARNSPRSKGVADLPDRISRLERFVAWARIEPLVLRDLAGPELWDSYWQRLSEIEHSMKQAQVQALALRMAIRQSIEQRRSVSIRPDADPVGPSEASQS